MISFFIAILVFNLFRELNFPTPLSMGHSSSAPFFKEEKSLHAAIQRHCYVLKILRAVAQLVLLTYFSVTTFCIGFLNDLISYYNHIKLFNKW